MQLLASALPGFRDLRAPLLAGYIWLLLLWIVIEPRIQERPTDGPIASVLNLADAVNPLWVGIAASFVAYLVGSISQILSPVVRFTTREFVFAGAYFCAAAFLFYLNFRYVIYPAFRARHPFLQRFKFWYVVSPIDMTLDGTANGFALKMLKAPPRADENPALKRLLSEGNAHLAALQRRILSPEWNARARQDPDSVPNLERLDATLQSNYQDAVSQLDSELSLPATLLVGDDSPGLFSETDRLKAEGELRLTVVPPIAALIVAIAASYGWVWLLLTVALFILAVQGLDREQKSQELIDSAIRQQKISPRSIEDFKNFVESIGAYEGNPQSAT